MSNHYFRFHPVLSGLVAALVLGSLPQRAVAQTTEAAVPALPVSIVVERVDFAYGLAHPELPDISVFSDLSVPLFEANGVWSAAADGSGMPVSIKVLTPGAKVDASAVAAITRAAVKRLNAAGIYGVWVEPVHLEQRGADLVDLRSGGDAALKFQIWASQVAEVRTLARGDRIPVDKSISNPKHGWIISHSPLTPGSTPQATGSLFKKEIVEAYLAGLSAQPGRRVEASVASAGEPGKVVLDYLVSETRSWHVFSQVSNTGTATTGEWRSRIGFQTNQLTNHDDILGIDLISALDFKTKAGFLSYEFPWSRPRRLVQRVFTSYGDFSADSNSVLAGLRYTGKNLMAGTSLEYRFDPHRHWDFTAEAGVNFSRYEVAPFFGTHSLGTPGKSSFLIPFVGVRASRRTGAWAFYDSLRIEHSLSGIPDTKTLQSIGRAEVDPSWTAIRAEFDQSYFLDALKAGAAAAPSHELTLKLRTRLLAQGRRLIAQEQDLLGGAYSVRGYPESVLSADQSFVGSFEYAYHIPNSLAPADKGSLFGHPFRWRPDPVNRRTDWDFVVRTFVDYASRWVGKKKDYKPSQPDLSDQDLTMLSAGVGTEIMILQNVSLRCDVGTPLQEIVDPNAPTSSSDPTAAAVDGVIVKRGSVRAHIILNLTW